MARDGYWIFDSDTHVGPDAAILSTYLSAAEKSRLAFSGKLITFETGLRFLADYLQGDVYFKVHRKDHNLDRARTQFKLVESIEQQEPEMDRRAQEVCA